MDGLKGRMWCLYLAIFFVLSLPFYAQADPSKVDDIVTKMKTELNLTPPQIDAVKPTIQGYMSSRKQLIQNFRQQGLTDKDALKSQIDQLKSIERQKLSQVLSQAQMDKWLEKENFNAMLNPDDADDTGNSTGMGGHRHRHSSEVTNEDSSSQSGE
jgi:primosomal protein N'